MHMNSIQWSPRLKAAMCVAESDAARAKKDCVGTEDVLLALFDGRDTISREILENLGVTREKLLVEIKRVTKA